MTDRVTIVVESSTALRPEEARQLGIVVIPLRLSLGGADLRDLVDVSPTDVYRQMRAGVRCSTAAPTLGDFLAAFDPAEGPVLCLAVGSGLSTMYQTAVLAAAQSSNPEVEVVDSGTAAGGLRLLALDAARRAAAGEALPSLAASARSLCARIEMAGMVESVMHLARTGRVPEIAAWGGTVLRVRPVVRFAEGRASLHRLVRGSEAGLRELRRLVRQGARERDAGPQGEGMMVTVFHADAEEGARSLLAGIADDFPSAELTLSEATPAMGIHLGPGVVGHALLVDREVVSAVNAA